MVPCAPARVRFTAAERWTANVQSEAYLKSLEPLVKRLQEDVPQVRPSAALAAVAASPCPALRKAELAVRLGTVVSLSCRAAGSL